MCEKLRLTQFGKGGPLTTRLGFGGIPIQTIPHKDAVDVVRYAYEAGIRFFDTARAYTTSESCFSEALSDVRDDVFIATKSGARTKEAIKADFEKSLSNLKTDHVDLFMFHNVSTKEALTELFSTDGAYQYILDQQQKGHIKLVGYSSHNVDVAYEIAKTGKFWSVEFPYNYLETQSEPELLPYTRDKGMGFVVMKPFAGGALKNPTAALKWLSAKNVDVIIPGMMSREQIDVAVSAVKQVEPLLKDEIGKPGVLDLVNPGLTATEALDIKEDIDALTKSFCRRCGYCLPCPQGIEVSTVMPMELLFNRGGWHKVEDGHIRTLEKALECIECGVCQSRCPYELPLATLVKQTAQDLLQKIDRYRASL